jgi:hypothetical protein
VVHNGENADGPTLRTLTIRSAYQIRHGNPFKRYLPVDFDFSRQMKIKLSGATIIETKENTLRVKIEKSDFRIEVKGFDSKRDVRVEVRQEEENRHAGTDN